MGFGDGLSGRGPHDYDEAGHFHWPKAIVMVRAWRSMPQPVLLDVLAEQLPYHATSQAVLLDGGDADAVISLKAEDVEIPASEALVKARLLDKALNPGRPTTGPEPSSWEGSTGRDVNRTAFTYAFRFGRTDIWKIGHAIDVKERLKQVNCHIPPEAVPERWDAKSGRLGTARRTRMRWSRGSSGLSRRAEPRGSGSDARRPNSGQRGWPGSVPEVRVGQAGTLKTALMR